MNSDLTWGFDIVVTQWPIILAVLVILAVVGVVVIRQPLGVFKSLDSRPNAKTFPSENWHTKSTKIVLNYLKQL